MRVHLHAGADLHEVDHEPKVGVLDQEDLFAQGIYVSRFIPGAKDVDALGSCTANATMSAVSNVLPEDEFLSFATASAYDDVVNVEEGAITFYSKCTAQTATPQTEYPPTDCGSSGPYIVQELQRLDLVKTDTIAHGPTNLISLMQADGVLMGSPWLNAWETPVHGVIDGDGSTAVLERQLRQGIAGGHETYLSAIEKLTLTETGRVVPEETILRGRNSWSASWGTGGSYYVHLSTLVSIGSACDFRQLVV
jgi:hypothetical protein